MRLIDADALKERFDKRIRWLRRDVHDDYSRGLLHGAETDKDLINEISTIDVVEVMYGRWEKEPPYTSLGGEYKKALICSECHSFFVSDGNKPWQLHNYCPNCGAKMAKGENHEQA